MRRRLLKFRLAEGRPFEAVCAIKGRPMAKFEAVFATRLSCNGVIPLAALPNTEAEALLSLPPTRKGDPKLVMEDILLGRMRGVERALALEVHADNGSWTSAELPFLLCYDNGLKSALIGNGFMMSQWSKLCLMPGLAVVKTQNGRDR